MKLNRNFKQGSKSALGLMVGLLTLGVASASDGMGTTSQQSKMDCDSKNMPNNHSMKGDPVARAKQHVSELKSNLNLTKEQESAMQTFSEQVTEQAKVMASIQDKLKDISSKNAPEHMAMMTEAAKTRAENMTNRAETIKTFYRVLNKEQQATFDKLHLNQMGYMAQMSPMDQDGPNRQGGQNGQTGQNRQTGERSEKGERGERGDGDELSELSQ